MKKSFDAGFQVPSPTTKKTAIDRFAAADAVVTAGDYTNPPGQPVLPAEPAQSERLRLTPLVGITGVSVSAPFRAWCLQNNYELGRVITLPLTAVKTSPFNPRHFYRKESIAGLAVNLSKQAQQHPIHVTPDFDNPGEFFIHDGGRRVRALRDLSKDNVNALVVDVPQGIDSYKLGYDLNTQHETQTVFDDAIVWRRLLDQGAFASQTALADALGVDKSAVTMTLAVGELPEDLIGEMLDHPSQFGMNAAYAVVKFFRRRGAEATRKFTKKVLDEGLSVRQINALVKSAEANPDQSKVSRQRYSQRLEIKLLDGVHVGDLRTYGDDCLKLDLKGLPRDLRDSLQERIHGLLDEERRRYGLGAVTPEQT